MSYDYPPLMTFPFTSLDHETGYIYGQRSAHSCVRHLYTAAMDFSQLEDIVAKRKLPAEEERSSKKRKKRVHPVSVEVPSAANPVCSGGETSSTLQHKRGGTAARSLSVSPTPSEDGPNVARQRSSTLPSEVRRDLYLSKCFHLSLKLTVLVGLRLIVERGSFLFRTVLFLNSAEKNIEFSQECLNSLKTFSFLLDRYFTKGMDFGRLATEHLAFEAGEVAKTLHVSAISKYLKLSSELIQAQLQDLDAVAGLSKALQSDEVLEERVVSLFMTRDEFSQLVLVMDCVQEYANVCFQCQDMASEVFTLHVARFTKRFEEPCLFYSEIKINPDEMNRLKTLLQDKLTSKHQAVKRLDVNLLSQINMLYKVFESEVILNYAVVKENAFYLLLKSHPWLSIEENV